jgi:hypothetical protein
MLAWGKDCELRASKPSPQVMRANPFFPAAIWRRRRQIAAGNASLVFLGPGVTPASLSLVGFTPGYLPPLLRSEEDSSASLQ